MITTFIPQRVAYASRCFQKYYLAQRNCLCLATLTVLVLTTQTSTCADERTELQQATNGTSIFALRIDSSNLKLPTSISNQELESASSIVQLSRRVFSQLEFISKSLNGEVGLFVCDLPYGSGLNSRLMASSAVNKPNIEKLASAIWPGAVGDLISQAGYLKIELGSSVEQIQAHASLNKQMPSQIDDWAAAFSATEDYPVQGVVVLPDYFRTALAELKPQLQGQFTSISLDRLLPGVDWISIGIHPDSLTMQMVVKTESVEAANALKEDLPSILGLIGSYVGLKNDWPKEHLQSAHLWLAEVKQDQLVVTTEVANVGAAHALMMKSAEMITHSLIQSQVEQSLKKFSLAIHNYESAYRSLPTYRDLARTKESSGLSWRVHILPFLGYGELYREFKLDEPWDSPKNIQLLDKMPEIYKPAAATFDTRYVPAFHTTYVAPVGESTVFGRDKPIGFGNVLDGLSNTIGLVEVSAELAIPWTSPEEYRFDPQDPASKLNYINGKSIVAMMDGSVVSLSKDAPWKELLTIAGGESVAITD